VWSAELGKHCLHDSIRHQLLLGCWDLVFKTSGIYIYKRVLTFHHQSHVDKKYKRSLLRTMLYRAFHLSSTRKSFNSECDHFKMTFTNLKYPDSFINFTVAISHFVTSVRTENPGVQARLFTNENAVH